ncbi:hypothetical protein IGI04_016405 [Brassica rapa subsp. trilocularis]|uniref:Uncharacterized protein n=2 Tax=Brassica TaxID=3705 RepID=A0ABQ8DM47_BRANA|nr:hypothetical protein IGI04_016405 [Brassica rapa subsp. trilocularis]KAH0930127.1 hypothetical protein HID58_015854 [Brassica napus]
MVEPQPPKWVLEALRRSNGMEARLVIADKVLSASDVKQSQARLMLPANKVLSKEEFLRDEEIRVLEGDAKATRYANVNALPDLGSFEDTDVVTSFYDDA